MVRSVGAFIAAAAAIAITVIAGTMLAAVVLAGPEGSATGAYLAANLAVSLGAAVLGGWLVARLAPRRPMVHAAALAAVIVALTLPGLGSPAPGQPSWYPAVILIIGVAGVAGGALVGARAGDGSGAGRQLA